jgi:hypothetical protein
MNMTISVHDDAAVPAAKIESCDGVACELLVDPIPRPEPEGFTVRTRPAQRRVILQDNQKPTSMTILREAEKILRERGVDVSVTIMPKESAGRPLEPQQLGQLAQERGLLLMGVND